MKNKLLPSLVILFFLTFTLHAKSDDFRIISASAGVSQIMFALGLEHNLIATDVTTVLPKDFKILPSIGYHRNLSAEGLLQLTPTHLIGSEHMGPKKALDILRLNQTNILQLPDAYDIQTLNSNILSIAKISQKENIARELIAKNKDKQQLLLTNKQDTKTAVFLLSNQGNSFRIAGLNTSGNAFIKLFSAKNLVEFSGYRDISTESLIALNPDIVFITSTSHGQSQTTKTPSYLNQTKAGKNNLIITVDGAALVSGLSIQALDNAIEIENTYFSHTQHAN